MGKCRGKHQNDYNLDAPSKIAVFLITHWPFYTSVGYTPLTHHCVQRISHILFP
jgi:hypothetical protein